MVIGNKKKVLGEHTNIYLYDDEAEFQHCRLDMMMKQDVFDLRQEGFGLRLYLRNGRLNWRRARL